MKLIVFLTTKARKEWLENDGPIELTTNMFTSRSETQLERYGQDWARWFKTDIVMMVED